MIPKLDFKEIECIIGKSDDIALKNTYKDFIRSGSTGNVWCQVHPGELEKCINDIFTLVQEASNQGQWNCNCTGAYRNIKPNYMGVNTVDLFLKTHCQLYASHSSGGFLLHGNQVTISWYPMNPFLNPQFSRSQPRTLSYLQTLYDTKEGSDVAFMIEGKLMYAHALILKQSLFFKNLFSGNWKEQVTLTTPIELKGFSIEAYNVLFFHLYTGKYPEKIDTKTCIECIRLGKMHFIQALVTFCKTVLCNTIDEDTYVQIVALSEEDEDVKTICKWYLDTHPNFKHHITIED